MITRLDNGILRGCVSYIPYSDAYTVQVWNTTGELNDPAIVSKSFGNGVDAEQCLLDLLEHPAWTLLKYT